MSGPLKVNNMLLALLPYPVVTNERWGREHDTPDEIYASFLFVFLRALCFLVVGFGIQILG